MTNDKVREGIAAFKAGNKILARQLLSEAVKTTPNNETAWLWLAACVETDDQKRYCLKRALFINPKNQNARTSLAYLDLPPQPSMDDIGIGIQKQPAKPSANSGTKVLKKKIPIEWIMLGLFGASIFAALVIIAVIMLANSQNLPGLGAVHTPPITLVEAPSEMLPNTPTFKATNNSIPSASCQLLTLSYLEKIQPLLVEFGDTLNVANSTSRIALGSVIQNLQEIKRNVAEIVAPDCSQPAGLLVVRGMDIVINAFIDFMGDVSDIVVQRKLNQGLLDLTNGSDQLIALASGQSTPIPKILPTDTPIPTPFPTPTPLPMENSFVIEDSDGNPWQIKITKIIIAESLKSTVSDRVEKASGRFVILFLEITNRGLSPDTFVGFGTLDIEDASGQHFVENSIASFYAENIYGADICAEINPDQAKNCVAVYDISLQSSFYILVPGSLADPYAPRVLLDIP